MTEKNIKDLETTMTNLGKMISHEMKELSGLYLCELMDSARENKEAARKILGSHLVNLLEAYRHTLQSAAHYEDELVYDRERSEKTSS